MSPQYRKHAHAIPAERLGLRTVPRSGLTLVELLVTLAIIAILAGIFLGALQSATEQAKEMKTKSMISKLNNLIMPRWDAYRTRRVPFNLGLMQASGTTLTSQQIARDRLDALHDLMRMELPDRWTDIVNSPITLVNSGYSLTRPSINQAYVSAFMANGYNPNSLPGSNDKLFSFQGAECLYMIVNLGIVDELGGRDLFNESNVGDTDGDGFPEFLDGWGMPIKLLRWPIGFTQSELNGAEGIISSAGNSGTTYLVTYGNPTDAGYPPLSSVRNAYVGKQVLIYSPTGGSSGGNPVWQSATVTASTPSQGETTLVLNVTLPVTPVAGDYVGIDPDPFDPARAYPTGTAANFPFDVVPFTIYPLIFSAGADKTYGIYTQPTDVHGNAQPWTYFNCYPFVVYPGASIVGGSPLNGDCTSTDDPNFQQSIQPYGWLDNIHNHLIGTR